MNEVNLENNSLMDLCKDTSEEYAENASFLWMLRSIVVTEANYATSDIAKLEQRIEFQLNGLMESVESSWRICEKALDLEQAGEVFTATVIAFRSRDAKKIQKAITAGLINNETFKGVVSALGWLPGKQCHSWIYRFLNSKDIDHKYLGIAACSVRREDPKDILNKLLQRDDCLAHDKFHARALRLIGELRRQDLMPALNAAIPSKNKNITFWANWSALLLGNKTAVNNLKPFILTESNYQDIAIQIVFRVIDVEKGRNLISDMVKKKNNIRAVIKSVGVLGDPHAINWLIDVMKKTSFARVAGEAFTNITGIDLQKEKLTIEPPEDSEMIPNDVLDDDRILMDEDESLPWPDVDKVATIWQKHGKNFIVGKRYFMGSQISLELLRDKISNSYQRQRQSAALELALIDAEHQLINVYQRI